jgi:Carboxypeptidase regulatory-like domain
MSHLPTGFGGRVSLVLLSGILLMASVSPLRAQSNNSSLSGTVKDQTGAVVPKADLTLTSSATGILRHFETGSDGIYRFSDLQAGVYTLKASAAGFAVVEQKGIVLTLNDAVTLDVKLSVGGSAETVQVSATASPINREDAAHIGEISPDVLKDLPLNVSGSSRSAASFVVILPGVNTASGNNPFETRINGGQKMGDEATLDGASMQEGLMSQSGVVAAHADYPISPEAISEVSVLTSTYAPQYGTTTSGVITMTTKSGTNAFHGDLREYLHNTSLNATQYGAPYKPKDIENQFGGSLGGPIKIPGIWSARNKAFFFINIERWTIRGGTKFPVYSIPSMQERTGDFSDWTDSSGNLIPIYDPATTTANPAFNPNLPESASNLPYLRKQFMGCNGNQPNVICATDPRLQNSLAKQWIKYLPTPTFPGALNNYVSPVAISDISGAGTDHRQNYDARIDDYFGQKDHFSLTFHNHNTVFAKVTNLPPQISNDSYLLPNGGEIGPWVSRASWDHTFSPNVLNNLNYGYLDFRGSELAIDSTYANIMPKIPGAAAYAQPPQINFTDGFLSMGYDDLHHEDRPTNIVNDVLSWSHGKHTFKFGGELRSLQNNLRNNNNQSGTFGFADTETGLLGVNSGSSFASFLLEQVDNASVSFNNIPILYARGRLYALFAGDTWKATPKMSVTYGLRWDVSTPSVEKYNRLSFLDPTRPNPGADGLLGTLAFAGNSWGEASFGSRHPENTYYHAVAPRLGINYALTPKTVIRTGYGIFYSQAYYPGWNGGIAQDGFNTTPTLSSSQGGLSPAMILSQGFPANLPSSAQISSSFLNGQSGPLYRPSTANRLPYGQQWNLTVDHEFTNNFYVSAAYVANKGSRLLSDVDPINTLNPALLSMGEKLFDEFQPGQATLDGVKAPYPGWAAQMQACAPSVAQALLPFPQFCAPLLGVNENKGSSTYHSLQLKAEHRFSRGFWVLTSYTFSKILTNADSIQNSSLENGILGASGVISPYQMSRNKSISDDDVPNVFNFSTLYELPVGKGKRFLNRGGIVNQVLGGWQINTLIKVSSGTPFFFRSSTCNVPLQFDAGCIPSQIPGVDPFLQNPNSYNPNKGPLLNPAAFQSPSSFNFNFGDGPRISSLRGPRFSNTDLSFIKHFEITERVGLQFETEFFNTWNQHIFVCETRCFGTTAFDNDIASPTFGQWNGNVSTPRNIQFALKLLF